MADQYHASLWGLCVIWGTLPRHSGPPWRNHHGMTRSWGGTAFSCLTRSCLNLPGFHTFLCLCYRNNGKLAALIRLIWGRTKVHAFSTCSPKCGPHTALSKSLLDWHTGFSDISGNCTKVRIWTLLPWNYAKAVERKVNFSLTFVSPLKINFIQYHYALSTRCVPGAVTSIFQWSYLILLATLWSRNYHYHLIGENGAQEWCAQGCADTGRSREGSSILPLLKIQGLRKLISVFHSC